MKLTKWVFTIALFTIIFHLSSIICLFAAGEDITVADDSKAQTVSLENAALPASGSEGEIRYNTTDDKLYVWDGAGWKLLSANKNVATKIVGVRRNPPNTALDSLDADRADYICNGVNDQQEINQAINEVANAVINPTQQGVVYLLDGTYNISAALLDGMTTSGIVLKSGISLIGAGAGTILSRTAGSNIISASGANNILISRLLIDGNSLGGISKGIEFNAVNNSIIDKVRIKNMVGSLGAGISILYTASFNNRITNCTINNNNVSSTYGMRLIMSSFNTISANNVVGCGYGIEMASSSNNAISDNNIQQSSPCLLGININFSSNNIISGNNIEAGIISGIWLNDSFNNIISGNKIWGSTTETSDIDIMAGCVNNTIVSNSIVVGPMVEWGIGVFQSSFNNIVGNIITGAPVQGGIKISSASISNNISSNYIDVSRGYGIDISQSTCSYNYLVANYIIDNVGLTAKINDAGANTKYTGKEKLTLEQVTDDRGNIRSDASYVKLVSGVGSTLDNGKSSGDILIIQGPDSGSVTPTVTNLKLCSNALHGTHSLRANDTLTLIWNATANAWLELSYTNN